MLPIPRRFKPRLEYLRATRAGHRGARLGHGAQIRVENADLELGEHVRIGPRTEVVVLGRDGHRPRMKVGARSKIGARCIVHALHDVTIGADSEISWNVQLMDTDFHEISDPDGTTRPHAAPIAIGDKVLVGTGAIVLKGVTIGDGAVVAAGSVVTKDVPPRTIVAGNPARVVRETGEWK